MLACDRALANMRSEASVLAGIKYVVVITNLIFVIKCTFGDTLNTDHHCVTKGVANVAFVILSQDTRYHTAAAHQLRESILFQARETNQDVGDIQISSESLNAPGSWTIVTILPTLHQKYIKSKISWVLFCDSFTYLNVIGLLDVLAEHNCSESKWIGYPIHSRRPTIIHHFASETISYPLIGSGFAISIELIRRFSHIAPTSNFFIDPSYETALAIYLNTKVILTPEYRFCLGYEKNCVTAPKEKSLCNSIVSRKSIYFAVKTFRENHFTRAQIIKDTWAAQATNLAFFSDLNDTNLPAIDIGVENTENGHCEKTIKIIQYIRNVLSAGTMQDLEWVVLTDDDTILSVRRLEQVLGCFNNEIGPVLLGERYGYGYRLITSGYDYITGGGGIAMNTRAVAELATSCECPTSDTPDDMWLGACAKQKRISVVHAEGFHQARPEDYSSESLRWMRPVTFHKLDILEPYKTYYEWFNEYEESYQRSSRSTNNEQCLNISRDEL